MNRLTPEKYKGYTIFFKSKLVRNKVLGDRVKIRYIIKNGSLYYRIGDYDHPTKQQALKYAKKIIDKLNLDRYIRSRELVKKLMKN